jgi:hypothetical protein
MMKPICLLSLFCIYPAVFAQANEFCDVVVKVRNVSGDPIEAPVKAVSPKGNVLFSTRSLGGVAKLCDVGLQEFAIVIGQDLCGQVTLNHLKATWPKTLVFPVILQNCHGFIVRTGCLLLMHMRDNYGAGIERAGLRIDGIKNVDAVSDKHGRIRAWLKFDADHIVDVDAAGFEGGRVVVTCSAQSPDVEATVVLKKLTQ